MDFISLASTQADRRRLSIEKVVSAVLHVVLIAAVTYQVRHVASVQRRGKVTARRLVPYAPGHTAVVRPPRPKIVLPKEEPKLALKQPEPPPPVSSGGDPTGEADVSLATANFYPDPKPDLSLIPHGTRGDVVIDIVIDEEGRVVDAKVDQGLAQGLDEAVIAVVETWTFYPATKAGKPVASEQQLLFHFERA